jgi:outer membrane receptor protein involved in Fe transport
MVNIPIGETVGVRLAGFFVDRDGYTENLFDGEDIDDREMYGLRGTIRFQPSASTTIDLIGYYFHESDNRSRIQKQLCNRDPTGILGCSPDSLEFETVNGNSTLAAILSSREFLTINSPTLTNFGLTSLYGADAFFGGIENPADLRTVNADYTPTYFVEEYHIMGRLEQDLGDDLSLTVTGGYAFNEVDSRTDYNLITGNSLANNPGLLNLAGTAAAPGAFFPGGINPFTPVAAAVIPNGPAGGVCTSEVNLQYTGIYGGFRNRCTPGSTDYDRSQSTSEQWSIEAHLDSNFDGPFNFWSAASISTSSLPMPIIMSPRFGLDYAAGILGAATALGQRAAGNVAFPNVFLSPPFFNNETNLFKLESYGLFGEVYWDASDVLRFTGGLRYSHDSKRAVARTPILSFPTPYGITDANDSPFIGGFDANASIPGNQLYADESATFDEFTGRLVGEYRFTEDNMVYASYSRGYKSGGINPPVAPEFDVPRTFDSEILNAFEIGSRNTFDGGRFQLNASAFYYDYGGLQLSRIVARTSVNDNTDAEVYGVELEGLWRPDRNLIVNFSASYLHSSIGDTELGRSTRCLRRPQRRGHHQGRDQRVQLRCRPQCAGQCGRRQHPGHGLQRRGRAAGTGAGPRHQHHRCLLDLQRARRNDRQPVGAVALPVQHADRPAAVQRPDRRAGQPQRQRAAPGAELEILGRHPVQLRARRRHDPRAPGRLLLHRQLFRAQLQPADRRGRRL